MTNINKAIRTVLEKEYDMYFETMAIKINHDTAIAKIKALVVESIKDEVPEKYDPNLSKELRNIKLEERRWLNMRNQLRGEIRSIFE